MGVFDSGAFKPRYMRMTSKVPAPSSLPPRYNRGIIGSAPPPPQPLTDAEIADRARAQGSAAGASASLGAATQVGQATQKANANAMNTASSMASGTIPPDPNYTLKDPGTLTAQGAAYRDAIARRLAGTDPIVQNAQQTADTNASRGRYMARTGTEEQAAQAGFAPGTIQYSRLMDNGMAGANQSALTGQNGVNELARNRSADALAAASGIEKDAYGNAIGERNFQVGRDDLRYQRGTDAQARQDKLAQQGVDNAHWQSTFDTNNSHWDTTNQQSQAEIEYQHQQDAQSRQDALDAIKRGDIDGAINAVQGAKAKNYLLSVKASGGDVLGALNGMFEGGTLKPEYRDATPAQDSLQGSMDFVRTVHPDWSEEQVQTAAIQRLLDLDKAKLGPVKTQMEDDKVQDAVKRLDSGTAQQGDFETAVNGGAIPKYTSQTLPIDDGAKALIGKTISLGGQQYTVVANGRVTNKDASIGTGTHTSYTVVQSPDGKVMYNYNGTLTDKPPVTKMGGDAGKSAVYDPATKTLSYVKL